MKKSGWSIILIAAVVLIVAVRVEAQQPAKIPRIGRLVGGLLFTQTTCNESLLQGLRELGYVEGKNIAIESRAAEEKLDRCRCSQPISCVSRSTLSSRLVRRRL